MYDLNCFNPEEVTFFIGVTFLAATFFGEAAFLAVGFAITFLAATFFGGAAFLAVGFAITFLAAAIAFSINDFFSAITLFPISLKFLLNHLTCTLT